MRLKTQSVPLFALLLTIAIGAVLEAVKFTSTWAAPEAKSVSFDKRKVAALTMAGDLSLRMSSEEALARELTARGMTGVAAYRLIPAEELKDVDRARSWFERTQVAGVVVLRPVSIDKMPRYGPELWVSSSYASLWGYYPYGWTTTYVTPAQQVGTDTRVVVESLIYEVATGKLLWAGVSEATNPKSLQKLIADLVDEAAKKIKKIRD